MTTTALVACSSQKADKPGRALDVYRSQLFRKSRRYAEANSDQWFILSAKYGLIHPETWIELYDVTLPGTGPVLTEWGIRVHRQLHDRLGEGEHQLLVLAGYNYRRWLPDCRLPATVPLEGKGVGDQLHWLTRQLTK